MKDVLEFHSWANARILDACAMLDGAQLDGVVPGTDRSILRTLRHLIGSDAVYLLWLTEDPAFVIETKDMDLAALRSAMARNAAGWSKLLSADPDLDTPILDADAAGYRRTASVGVRLAQAVHHGSDHRSQISTALTVLGVEPPAIDVWEYGNATGRVIDIAPAS